MKKTAIGCAGRRRRRTAIAVVLGATAPAAWAATITGQISDASGTRALNGASVELVEPGRRDEAGADGSFRFVDVAPGTYTLRVRYADAEPLQRSVTVQGDETVRADVALAPASGTLATVLVVGQRANLSSSISRQREADGVESVLTRDAIGQFPDQNVAEAVRRAPGVNVLNDQGEGRFISVRGLDPGLNAASINGVRVMAPEADTRAVALDVIPSELVESIEIKKSLTPDMDADALGASIEIKTTSAFDRKKPYASIAVEGSYNDLNGEWSPKLAADFSRRFGRDLGVAGGLSYYKRRFSTDNIEADDWDTSDSGVDYAGTVEYRDYDVTRERLGGSLSLDWRADDRTALYLRGLYSKFDDQEYRGRLTFEFDEAPSAGDATHASFRSDDGEIAVTRDLKDRFESQTITSIAGGGHTDLDAWAFDYQLSWSKADELDSGSLDPTAFERKFEDAGAFAVDFDYANRDRPRFDVTTGAATFIDPAEYEFDKLERTTRGDSQDRELAVKLDVARDFALASGDVQLKAGAKLRRRDKTYNGTFDIYKGYDGDFTLADVVGRASYGLADIDPVPGHRGVRRFFNENRAGFERDDADSAYNSAAEDYDVGEDISAGYVLGRWQRAGLRVVGGVRVEHTENDLAGNEVEFVEDELPLVTPVQYERRYTDWLPSLNARYEATGGVVLRAAAWRSLLRPSVGQIAPRFRIEDGEGEFGNPALDAMHAWNYDAGAEWYFGRNAVVQLGYFHKDIEDFIVTVDTEDFEYNGAVFDEVTRPVNGDRATVDGLEFNYQQSLSFLPGPFDGLLIGVNFTYTDASGKVDGREAPLPASSRRTANFSLGYEKGPLSLRLASTYRSEYLDELAAPDKPEEDRYVDAHQQLDFTAKYRVTPRLQLLAEVINITDEPYVAYQRGPGRERLLQYEEYSYTIKAGLRANF